LDLYGIEPRYAPLTSDEGGGGGVCMNNTGFRAPFGRERSPVYQEKKSGGPKVF